MLTNDYLLLESPHPSSYIGGTQRIYRFKDGHGLSVVNSPKLHAYPFAWEIAVVSNVKDDGNFDALVYDTELTSDVEVFSSDEEANEFIARAARLFS